MKKKWIWRTEPFPCLTKTWRIMRLSVFFLFVMIAQVWAVDSYSQVTRLSLNLKDTRVIDVLGEIEEKTEFYFLFNQKLVDVERKVDVDVRNRKIEDVLNELFAGTNVNYLVMNRQIVLTTAQPGSVEYRQQTEVQQQNQITGRVTDRTGAPLPGVTVVIKGTTGGTITDGNGNYVLGNVAPNTILVFSFVGMRTQEVFAGNQTVINVSMQDETIGIEEIVAIGYGTMKKSDLTGSVVSVSSDALQKSVNNTFDQALQGRAAGVQVTLNSGAPGAATAVRIRGTNSLLGSNEPLYIIDGVQISGNDESVIFVGNGGNRSAMRTSPLTNLNPNDIESIEVLKDASATAIYGNRGANGVIIVTTKRGKKGDSRINYSYNHGVKSLTKRIDVMGLQDYAAYNNEQALSQRITPRPEFANPASLTGGTDWQTELFETGQIENHNLSFSGGSEKITYFLSGGYNSDSGPVLNSWFKRYSLRANIEVDAKEWLKFGNNFNFGQSNTKYVFADSNDSPLFLSVVKAPDIPVYDANGGYIGVLPNQVVPGGGLAQANPLALTEDRDSRKKKFELFNNAYFDIIVSDFRLRTELNVTQSHVYDYAFYGKVQYPGFTNETSQLNEIISGRIGYEFKNILYYSKKVGNHAFNGMAAHEVRQGWYENISGSGGDFYNNNLNSLSLSNSKLIGTGGTRGRYRSESYLARVFYNFNDLVMITSSIRADGSPNFPEGNRWGYFPSFSGAIRLSNLEFMKNLSAVNNLKINGGWGQVGSDNVLGGHYRPLVQVSPSTDGSFTTTFLNYDPNLRWEATSSTNLGIELGLFESRINMQLELYHKKTKDALNYVLLPSSVGSGIQKVSNIASVQNKGLELTLNTVNIDRQFKWKTDFTFTLNRNKILDLGEGGLPIFGSFSKNVEGGPIGRFWGYKAVGLYQNFDDIATSARWNGVNSIDPRTGLWIGDYKFEDINDTKRADWSIPGFRGQHDASGNYIPGTAVFTGNSSDVIVIKNASVIDADDQTFIGDPNPDFTFGLNNTFSYKNFDCTIYLVGVYGNEIYNQMKSSLLRADMFNRNTLAEMKDRAVPILNSGGNPNNIFDYTLKNPDSKIPRIRNDHNFSQASVNSRFIEDGSYLRVQNIVLGYTLPAGMVQKVKMDRARIYINAQNLHTFTKYSGWDPAVGNIAQSSLNAGFDAGRYPVARIILFGAEIGF